jgi:hypothetical protein
MRVRPTPILLAVTGLALLAAALVTANLEAPAGEIEVVEESLTGTTPNAPEIPAHIPAPAPALIPPNPISRFDQFAALPPAASPVSLVIDAIEVEAPVVPYGINDRTGQMAVPRNTTEVAWYKFGPAPGQPGSAVLAAHVDLVDQGEGVFFDLKQLQPGDRIVVGYDDGTEQPFDVVGRVVYEKDELPIDVIFSRDGAPVLTLITCGGGFNDIQQRYDSNVVVYAVPSAPDSASA